MTASEERLVAIKCKRIIDGKTYNTETATHIAGWDDDDGPFQWGHHLYQTRFGAFFLYAWGGPEEREEILPYTPEQARKWLEKYQYVDLIEKLFGEMPEAGSGETKFTLRMPDSLRDRLADRAKANNQSLNAWIVRCLESCAAESVSGAGNGEQRDIPPMGNMVGSNRTGWRTRGT
ncbi:hypothetical protein BSN85_24840 [Bradyrhizobium brasilense]|nr:hypothetical protein BSN85_24840 [Bradyrhizobium brasilense]